MKPLALVVGAGGHGRVVGASLRCLGIDIVAFIDPEYRSGEETIAGAPVVGNLDALGQFAADQHDAYVAIGNNAKRKATVERLRAAGYGLPPLIHPASSLNYRVRIGEASCVCMGAKLSTEVIIGKGVIVNTGTVIDHECDIADFVHVAPGVVIAGRVSVGDGAFLGMGSHVAETLSIGREAVIGAGSVVLKDVPDGAKVLGVYH